MITPEGIDRRFYEICALSELKNALRSGDIWVKGSRQFRDFDDNNLPAVELARKRSLIQRILEDDAEVRRHTEPWMEHVRQYLGNSVRRRDVERAYAAGSGEPAAGNFGA